MRKSRTVTAMTVLTAFISGTTAVHAEDDINAQIAAQCPAISTRLHAKNAEAAADRKEHPMGKPGEPALRAELLKMLDADQKVRYSAADDIQEHQELLKKMYAIDDRNRLRIKQIDGAQGFPTKAQVGNEGVRAAFKMVLYADDDTVFQAHVLDELTSRPDQGGVDADDYATVTDHVLAAQNKPQRYGTQLMETEDKKRLQPRPMEDPANVDKRRAAIGLVPLANYVCELEVTYRELGEL